MMARAVEVTDNVGHSMNLLDLNGVLYPPFQVDSLNNFRLLELRIDDVLICAYPKSGTHWLFDICRMLVQGTTAIEAIPKEDYMIELMSREQLDGRPSPRILNTHVRFNKLPTDFSAKKPKIVRISRNHKDVAVSLYFHLQEFEKYKGTFTDYLYLFTHGKVLYNSWYDYELDWKNAQSENPDLNMMTLTYENLKTDPIKEIRRISDFLGVERKESLIHDICQECDFNKMRKRNAQLQLPNLSTSAKMYRKGEIGDWKNWFTVAQSEWFDDIYRSRMINRHSDFENSIA